jgi:LEA14-like dessication related protein
MGIFKENRGKDEIMVTLIRKGIKPINKITWSVLIFLLLMGCTMFEQFLQKPSVTCEQMELTDISFDEATLLFHFKIHNPNPFGTSIDYISYQLGLNKKKFINGNLKQGITLAASGAVPIDFPVTIRYFDFFESIQDFIQSDQIQYDLSGSMRIGPFDVPYRTSGNLPVPKLPEISLKQVKIDQISLKGATLLFTLGLKNENMFTIVPQALHYEISLVNISFVRGKTSRVKSIQGDSESVMELPVAVNFLSLGKSAYHLLTGSSSSYQLSGDLQMIVPKIGVKKFPFKKQGDVTLKR